MNVEDVFSKNILNKYEIKEYNHALAILKMDYPNELNELKYVLENVHLNINDVLAAGGSKSPVVKKYETIFYSIGWREVQICGDLDIQLIPRTHKENTENIIVPNYVNGYNIDYFKNKVAIDTEWNSKDQTFDRDLKSYSLYYRYGIISVGIIITRGTALKDLPGGKSGASTTWMGKLVKRLESRRTEGCPILAIGIKPEAIEGYNA
ncbi:BglII/BstYI family type II restriction endonuclease [uncultured Megasphaera sp.]|uniref:BglII/BstYI family type II restriction endonuclease n=1 Tax=Megasphaera massiliensis TaxID=1232428 RepID=UPI00266CB53C|nr:BglII/BstYI family type II restriction endonuclease [uncultured Megasphaera sp.]